MVGSQCLECLCERRYRAENWWKWACPPGCHVYHCQLGLINTYCLLESWPGNESQLYPFTLKTKARCEWVFLSRVKGAAERQGGDRGRVGERQREDTSAWDLGDFTFCQEQERKTAKWSERKRDTASLKYNNRVRYQPKILLLTSLYCVSITSVQGLCNITTSVYNDGEITVCERRVCTATCLPCRDGRVNSSCVPQGP